jgi:hypothetical protein
MSEFANEILFKLIKHSDFSCTSLLEDERLSIDDVKIIKSQIYANVYIEDFNNILLEEECERLLHYYPILALRRKFLHELKEFNGNKISFIENYPDNLYVDKNVKRAYTIFFELANNNGKTYSRAGDENESLGSLIDILETRDLAAANTINRERFDRLFSHFKWSESAREIAYIRHFLDKIRFIGVEYFRTNVVSELEKIQEEISGFLMTNEHFFRIVNLSCNAFLRNYTKNNYKYARKILEDQLYFFNLSKSPSSLTDILICKVLIGDFSGCIPFIKENPVIFSKIKSNRIIMRSIKSFAKDMYKIRKRCYDIEVRNIIDECFGNEINLYQETANFKSQKLRLDLTIECCCCMELMKTEEHCIICTKCRNYIGHSNCISKFLNDGKGCPLCRAGKQ